LQANISRRAKDQAERVHAEEVFAEIDRRLGQQRANPDAFAGVLVCPEDAGDIADIDEARLVILHPRLTHRRNGGDSPAMAFAGSATEHRGAVNRTYRNMLVYLAADEARMEELERAVRDHLAWSWILDNESELDLTANQRNQATERRARASETVDARLLGAYQWALVPYGQPIKITATKVEGQATSLAERVGRRLGSDGALAVRHAPAAIRHQLDTTAAKLWEAGHLTVGALWRLYAEYPYMPRLRDRAVLDAGLTEPQLLWEQEGFALADGYDEASGRYRGLVLPDDGASVVITNETLIVRPDRATAQRADDRPPETVIPGGDGAGGAPADGTPETEPTAVPAAPGKTRFFGSKRLQVERYASDFKKLTDEVLAPLEGVPGVTVNVTVEIEATAPGGFDEAKIRTVSENARTLGFEQSGFEDG
jgi:hypothetical protein